VRKRSGLANRDYGPARLEGSRIRGPRGNSDVVDLEGLAWAVLAILFCGAPDLVRYMGQRSKADLKLRAVLTITEVWEEVGEEIIREDSHVAFDVVIEH
jgi:hypothetical protein